MVSVCSWKRCGPLQTEWVEVPPRRPPRRRRRPAMRLAGADGRWTRVDALGHHEAVTIGRQYRVVTASASSLMAIEGDAQAWVAARPADPGDYPGVLALPADAQVLATFDVPPGVYPGAEPCREA